MVIPMMTSIVVSNDHDQDTGNDGALKVMTTALAKPIR